MSVYRRVTDLQKIMVRSQDYLQLWNGKKNCKGYWKTNLDLRES